MRGYRENKYVDGILHLKCTKCSEWKPYNNYDKGKGHIFGLRTECKSCLKEKNRKRYELKREHIASINKKYYWNNREKTSERKRKYYLKTNKQGKNRDEWTEKLGFNWQTFHEKARDYVNKNSIKPKDCSICGVEGKIEIHHPSYENENERSSVVFCCRSCHKQIHSGRIPCPSPINLLELTD